MTATAPLERRLEEIFPELNNLEVVNGMEDTHQVMIDFGRKALDLILEKSKDGDIPQLLVPTMGSIIPTMYVLSSVLEHDQELFKQMVQNTRIIDTSKVGEHAVINIDVTDIDPDRPVLIFEDIIDDGGTARRIEENLGHNDITFAAVFAKPGSIEKAQGELENAKIKADLSVITEKQWIISGGGMDGGLETFLAADTIEGKAYLALLQRLCRVGYYYKKGNLINDGVIEEQIQHLLFLKHILPWIRHTDALAQHMWQMERAKIAMSLTKDPEVSEEFRQDFIRLSNELLPLMIAHMVSHPPTAQ